MVGKRYKEGLVSFLRRALPAGVKRKIFHLGFNLDLPEFERFAHDYANAPSMGLGLRRLKARGLKPRRILDIGAYEGNWSLLAHEIWPDADIVMFEANEDKKPRLEAVAGRCNARLHVQLLGEESGQEVVFHVMESGSSVLEENSPLDRTERRVKVRSLDDLLGAEVPDFVKIDVQGYELAVLRGGSRALAAAEAVLLEVSLLQINKGAPLLAEVVSFMDAAGFQVADILEIHRRPLDGATNQVDLLFLRRGSALVSDTRHF